MECIRPIIEILAEPPGSYKFTNIRPGGNDTCLIEGVVKNQPERKRINDLIMAMYPSIEQVGFVNYYSSDRNLQMAGGEFCGNATRSTAWLKLDGKPGEVRMRVSGVEGELKAGVTENGDAYAQMPIYEDPQYVRRDPSTKNAWTVVMEGITLYVNFDMNEISGLSSDQIKQKAMATIRVKDLDGYPAAGVIYAKKRGSIRGGWEIKPIVYVKEIDTLFEETACGSGTTALGMVLSLSKGGNIKDESVLQPSGMPIKISVEFDGQKFIYAQVKGPIQPLNTGRIEFARNFDYIIEKINQASAIEALLSSTDLTRFYQDTFSKEPYLEEFSEREVAELFREYVRNGKLFIARTTDSIIGFGAALPLTKVPEIAKLAEEFDIKSYRTWYMADLAVKEEYRNQGVAKELVKERMRDQRGIGYALMRTSVENTKSQNLYRSLGFYEVKGMIQEVEMRRTDNTVKRDKRIFMFQTL